MLFFSEKSGNIEGVREGKNFPPNRKTSYHFVMGHPTRYYGIPAYLKTPTNYHWYVGLVAIKKKFPLPAEDAENTPDTSSPAASWLGALLCALLGIALFFFFATVVQGSACV